jgi:hypothetical protein
MPNPEEHIRELAESIGQITGFTLTACEGMEEIFTQMTLIEWLSSF